MAETPPVLANLDRPFIRRYAPADRESIRRLAVACADPGVLPECMRDQHGLVADILARYYTDFEPESCWVADDPADGVVGYLLGCLSTTKRLWAMVGRIIPAFAVRTLVTGAVLSCPLARLTKAGLSTWRSGHAVKAGAKLDYPAHLHVCVRDEYRRHGLAKELVLHFVAQASDERVSGIHAAVVEANLPARALFETLGFDVLGRYEALFPGSWTRVWMLLFGKTTNPVRHRSDNDARSPATEDVDE